METAATVAHELGHFSLTDHHRVLFENGALHRSESGFTSGAWYEREADLFGVELLIPEFLFHKHRREFATGLDGVKGLAELFQTSLTASRDSVRDAIDGAGGRGGERGGPEPLLGSVEDVRFESRGERCGEQSSAGAGGESLKSEGSVPAKQWFPGASGELVEEVIRLGRYGKTLTVLSVSG